MLISESVIVDKVIDVYNCGYEYSYRKGSTCTIGKNKKTGEFISVLETTVIYQDCINVIDLYALLTETMSKSDNPDRVSLSIDIEHAAYDYDDISKRLILSYTRRPTEKEIELFEQLEKEYDQQQAAKEQIKKENRKIAAKKRREEELKELERLEKKYKRNQK